MIAEEQLSPGRAQDPLVAVAGLTIDFWSNDRWNNVVNDATFSIARGEALGLVGESGCGKTTTALALLGFQRPGSRIRSGTIAFGGRDLAHLVPPRAAEGARATGQPRPAEPDDRTVPRAANRRPARRGDGGARRRQLAAQTARAARAS